MLRAGRRAAREKRMRKIAEFRVHKPGITQRQLREELAEEGFTSPSGRPYSLGAINRDCQELDQLERAQMEQDVAIHRTREYAELQEVKRWAWNKMDRLNRRVPDLEMILKAVREEAELLGTKAPTKIAPTTPDGKNEYPGLTDDDRLARLAELFDAARARRDGQAPLGGGASPSQS